MASVVADVAMVFAPALGYIPQYRQIQKSNDTAGFSTLVSLILFIANILRIFFWFGARFETSLLFQAIVMIIAQLILLELCTRLNAAKKPSYERRTRNKTIFSSPIKDFWAWDDYLDYIIFLTAFAAMVAVFSLVWLHAGWFVEVIGFLSLGIEATLGLPQLIRNHQKKSTKGLSVELIASWFLGDGVKTIYFVFIGAPKQFIMCGAFQLLVDIVISLQILTYGNKPAGPASSASSSL